MSAYIDFKSTKYQKITKLGKGGFGTVYLVLNKKDNKSYAMKEFSIENETKEKIDFIEKEAIFLSKFESKYIVKYYDCEKVNNKFYILMEYCDGTNLENFIKEYREKNELISQEILYKIIRQICLGIRAIHSKNIIHRDLKPENIFMNSKKEIKIGDFGISKQLDSYKKYTMTVNKAGTQYYISPEIIGKGIYNYKTDIYSLGCIIYELFTLRKYYLDKLTDEIKDIDETIYGPRWKNVIKSSLIPDYNKRPDINQIYELILGDNYEILGILDNKNIIEKNYDEIMSKKNQY